MLDLSHKNLEVYRIAKLLLCGVYKLIITFPKEEQYSLVAQMRRAAISVCSNIAEGAARISKKEKKRFYEVARSSVVELDTQLEIAILQQYLEKKECMETGKHLESTFRLLSKMINNLNNVNNNTPNK